MPDRLPARHLTEGLSHRLVLCRRLPPSCAPKRIHTFSEDGLTYIRRSLRIPDDGVPIDVLPAAVGEMTAVGRFRTATSGGRSA